MQKWERVKSNLIANLKLFRARIDTVINPRNNKAVDIVVLEAEDAANVVAITPDQEIVFVKQYRFGIQEDTIELPGGIVEPGEAQEIAVQRELVEETGFIGKDWTYLGKIPSNPVFMDSFIYHWLAKDVVLTEEMKLDDGESIELVFIPIKEIPTRLKAGYFQHPHTVNALVLFLAHQNALT